MIINLSDLDRKILSKHDAGVRMRALIELEIVHALIAEATKYGYRLQVVGEPTVHTPGQLISQLFDLDNAIVRVFDGSVLVGWIHLVFGNSGWDLISDYSTNLESFLKPVNDLASFWG